MIQLEQIKNFFPPSIRDNPIYQKYMIKEYIQLMILDYLSFTYYIRKITFIGGTNLRLVKEIDRFSEDLDFDCKDLPANEFISMTDKVLVYLQESGFNVETRDRKNDKLNDFRRNFYFPEFLFNLGLSGHKDERFLIKIESQDQQINYQQEIATIKGCGFYFSFPVPSDSVMCSMKLSALLNRQKGRDFYDSLFLLSLTSPDYNFLETKCNISNLTELKNRIAKMMTSIDIKQKSRDFEHLLFNKNNSQRILAFSEFIEDL